MIFSTKKLSQTVTQLCAVKQIQHIVLSPGSRNAPLTIGFTENSYFKNYSIVDERCAAFFALGMAQQLKKPVALVCTSGSALLNYYPAIAEAYYSDIPLIVLSADRPTELQEIGDGQTIQQENVYANHILYNANCKEGAQHQLYNETQINIALNTAIELSGPVHINIPFSEPLYDTTSDLTEKPQHVPARRNIENIGTEPSQLETIAKQWNRSKKRMILVGVLAPESLSQQLLEQLVTDDATVVLTETTSNLQHPNIFQSIDQLIAPMDATTFKELQPEIVLTFGGMIVSKKIKAFLRTYQPKEHYHIDFKKGYDTFFCLTAHIKVSPATFFNAFLPLVKKQTSTYFTNFKTLDIHRKRKHKDYIASIPYSDFKVFARLLEKLPDTIILQLSNSTVIRYTQLFDLNPSFKVFCNRGTSGIDGSTSTAIGASVIAKNQTVFITGDLSFLYDSNGLWNNYIPHNFKIIIINNSGGGIFRILPKAKETTHFEHYFETKHTHTGVHLAAMYGFEYIKVENEISLDSAIDTFFNISENPAILEIFTPNEINDKILLDYFKYIK